MENEGEATAAFQPRMLKQSPGSFGGSFLAAEWTQDQPVFIAVISVQCVTAHGNATAGLQACCGSVAEGNVLVGPLGCVSPPPAVRCALSIVEELMVCLTI